MTDHKTEAGREAFDVYHRVCAPNPVDTALDYAWCSTESDRTKAAWGAAERKARMSGELWEAVKAWMQEPPNSNASDAEYRLIDAFTAMETAK